MCLNITFFSLFFNDVRSLFPKTKPSAPNIIDFQHQFPRNVEKPFEKID
jgi:hypothetical protein